MDAIIERTIERAFTASQAFADNRGLTIIERLVGSMADLNLNHQEGEGVLLHLNQPQNALLHEKTNQILLERAPQILLPIIQDGIAAGDMKTNYPYESLEMILTYSLQVFGSSFQALPPEKQQKTASFSLSFRNSFSQPARLLQSLSIFDSNSKQLES